jgi:pilus assembly protein Flp/PilA
MNTYGQTVRSLMRRGKAVLARFHADEDGTVSMEYGFIAALISIAILATVMAIGDTLRDDFFTVIATGLKTASGTPAEGG